MDLQSVLLFATGLTVGVLLFFLYHQKLTGDHNQRIRELTDRLSGHDQESARMQERNQNLEYRVASLDAEREKLQNENTGYQKEVAGLTATNSHLEEKLASFKKEISEIQDSFRHEFKVMAGEIMEEKSKRFTEQNKLSLEQLLNPLGEKIRNFEKKVDDTYKEDVRDRISLKEQIIQLSALNSKMTLEASNLTRALKGETKSQGSWGEVILERVLERSGLQKDREYVLQPSYTSDGRRRQPDVIIHLPDNKQLIIDSKVSLIAYERFVSAEDDITRTLAIKEHILSIRRHIKDLSGKNYQNLYGINSPDFVLLFMPVEPSFGLAMQHEPELYNEAFDKNIVIVSPTTLLATLATISNVWKQEYQNRNAMEIAEAGGKLYDKFVGFSEDLVELGRRLDQTHKSYEGAMNKLQNGRGNLVRQAERIRDLGARSSKTLPVAINSRNEEED